MQSDDRGKRLAQPGGQPSILIVEDHRPTSVAVAALLEGAFEGCALLMVDSAEGALRICETGPPTVVVMDVGLPGMNGFEATRRIKRNWPQTQVVMYSTSAETVYREHAAAVGASSFLGKECTSTELVPTIAALLREAAGPRG